MRESFLIIYINSSHTPSLAVATKRLHNTLTRGNAYQFFLETERGKMRKKMGNPEAPIKETSGFC